MELLPSSLKIPIAGRRASSDGSIDSEGSVGRYWSSSVNAIYASYLSIYSVNSIININDRASGLSVRCIMDILPTGNIDTLDCEGVSFTGELTEGIAASGVSVSVPYTGGNGGTHFGQSASSVGVTGLTASTPAGSFNNGSGNLMYTITGIPSGHGSATFLFNIGGQTCELSIPVVIAPFICGTSTVTFFYNGSTMTYGTVQSANNRCWLDRNLGATRVATNSTDASAYGDLFQWGRLDDGHQVRTSPTTGTLSNNNIPGHGNFITVSSSPYDWRSPQNNNLWQGVNGTNNPCPHGFRVPSKEEWEAEWNSWGNGNYNADGAFSSPLKLPLAGSRNDFYGSISFEGESSVYHSSTINNTDAWYMYLYRYGVYMASGRRALGWSVRCIMDDLPSGKIDTLDCQGATINGVLNQGMAANGVSVSVPYAGGNGGTHFGQTATSTGVTGLTASTPAGSFNNGSGNLIYTITGIPSGSGSATFLFNIGGQTCEVSIPVAITPFICRTSTVTFVYNGTTVTYGTVQSANNRCWLDRNLGASRVATSSTDASAYGHLFQWGRLDDGHQVRNSLTTGVLSNNDVPGHGYFITSSSTGDWRSSQNNNLWQGEGGVNNPCPDGFRLPTQTEWDTEHLSWSSNDASGAFVSPLKLPMAGYRHYFDGSVLGEGSSGYYWSSTVVGTRSWALFFFSDDADMYNYIRALGMSVRCLKD